MDKQLIFRSFNTCFLEFINDVERLFPDDLDVGTAKCVINTVHKMNPKLMILLWRNYIANKYADQINNNDEVFFLKKDYTGDLRLKKDANNLKALNAIERLKEPLQNLDKENKQKTFKYLQNLTKLSAMYFNE